MHTCTVMDKASKINIFTKTDFVIQHVFVHNRLFCCQSVAILLRPVICFVRIIHLAVRLYKAIELHNVYFNTGLLELCFL